MTKSEKRLQQDALKNRRGRRRSSDCKLVNNGCRERSTWTLQQLRLLIRTRMTLLEEMLIEENKEWRRRVFSSGEDVFTFTPECRWQELGLNFTEHQASLAPRTNRRPRGDTNSLNWQRTFCTGFLSRISPRKPAKPGYSTLANEIIKRQKCFLHCFNAGSCACHLCFLSFSWDLGLLCENILDGSLLQRMQQPCLHCFS